MAKLLLATLLVVLANLPAQASAHTPEESAAIADRWAMTEVPHLPNHCSGGRLKITYEVVNSEGIGWAHGWVWDGFQFVWDYTKCEASIIPGLSTEDDCAARAHELMHFVIGPQHVGPLDPRHPGPVECFYNTPKADPVATKRVRRSSKQIARTIRFRKAQARIKARVAMKRLHARRNLQTLQTD